MNEETHERREEAPEVRKRNTHASAYLARLNGGAFHRKSTRTKAIAALALVSFFWGATWIASREGVQHMPALQLAGIRQFLGGFCYVLFFLFRGTPFPKGKE